MSWEGVRGLEGLWVDVHKMLARSIQEQFPETWAGRQDKASLLFSPPSSELRLSAEARNLGEESAGCVYVARGRELLVLFSLGEGREGKGREEGRERKGREGREYSGLDTADKELWRAGDTLTEVSAW